MTKHKFARILTLPRGALELPSEEIRARCVTESHVVTLMEKFEITNSTRIFRVVIRSNSLFGRIRSGGWASVKPEEFLGRAYHREIIAGAHSFVATGRLAVKAPANKTWTQLTCELYVTPADEEAAKQLSLFGSVENLKQATSKAMDFADMLRQIRGRLLSKTGKKQKGELQEMAAQFALMNKRTSAATIASYSYLAFWPEPLWRIVDILLDLETADHKKLINSPTLFQPLNQLHLDDDKSRCSWN
jgi:hypothetical protein